MEGQQGGVEVRERGEICDRLQQRGQGITITSSTTTTTTTTTPTTTKNIKEITNKMDNKARIEGVLVVLVMLVVLVVLVVLAVLVVLVVLVMGRGRGVCPIGVDPVNRMTPESGKERRQTPVLLLFLLPLLLCHPINPINPIRLLRPLPSIRPKKEMWNRKRALLNSKNHQQK